MGAAATGVVVAEIAARVSCDLYINAIAGRAAVRASTVRNALRKARSLSGILHVETR